MSKNFTDQVNDTKAPGLKVAHYGLGTIRTSLFSYITPTMIIIFSSVLTIILTNLDKIQVFFMTNMALNGLIIGLGMFGIFGAIKNNFDLYFVARFLNRMEDARKKTKVSHLQVKEMQKYMATKASLLDTQNMHNAIGNLESFGHYNFSDTDARLIKSKVGFRISGKKSSVGFLSGILVMLGLLGTFLGLLATIDAVGDAMAGMATLNIEEDGAISKFIGSLSAPLQGMGLAFSSSLFGLSGSLMIGFFNFLCGGAQNNFIENFSRWIDNRIPKRVEGEGKDGKGGAGKSQVPSALSFDDELKDWLSGYVALTVETNKQLKALAQTLNETLSGFGRGEMLLEHISNKQDVQIKHAVTANNSLTAQENLIGKGNETLSSINHHASTALTEMNTYLYPFLKVCQENSFALIESMKIHTEAINEGLSSVEQTLQMTHYQNQETMDGIGERINVISKRSESAYETIASRVLELNKSINLMDEKYDDFVGLPDRLDTHLNDIAKALTQAEKQHKLLFEVFTEVNGSSGPIAKLLFKVEKSMLEMHKKVFNMETASRKFVNKVTGKKTTKHFPAFSDDQSKNTEDDS